jgi:hypothetical protein
MKKMFQLLQNENTSINHKTRIGFKDKFSLILVLKQFGIELEVWFKLPPMP